MLDLLRKKAGSLMIKFILATIIIVFVFWGVGNYGADKARRVAMVDGTPIGTQAYQQAYNQAIDQLRGRTQSPLTEDQIKDLRRRIVDQLVDRQLLLNAADRLNLQITDQTLAAAISQYPAFQAGGQFDAGQYQRVLASAQLTPETFETMQRGDLLINQLERIVTASVDVSEDEAKAFFNWQKSKVRVDYVLFDSSGYSESNPADDVVRAHFDKQPEAYLAPATAKARYVIFRSESFKSQVAVDDDTIADYYDRNPDAFRTPARVTARHILIKLAADADEAEVATALSKAQKIEKEARGGKDFAELAKQYSEGPTRDRGGLLGTFERNQMVKPFADAAFSMAAGDISEPVRTDFGWHVIKTEAVMPERTETLEGAKEKIKGILTSERAKTLAYDAADAFYGSTFGGGNFDSAAAEFKQSVLVTDTFTSKGPAGVADGAAFAIATFALEDGDISDIVDMGSEYCVVQLLEKKPAAVPPFKNVKDRVRADVIDNMKWQDAKADAEKLLSVWRDNPEALPTGVPSNAKAGSTDFFDRYSPIPEIGFQVAISQEAFALSKAEPVSSQVFKTDSGYVIIGLSERQLPEMTEFEAQQESVADALKQQKARQAFAAYVKSLRDGSTIVVEPEYLR